MSALTMKASVELSAPFRASDLREFFATVPDNARVSLTTRTGGSQRDPYPTGYFAQATWEVDA